MKLAKALEVWIEDNLLDVVLDEVLGAQGVYDTPLGRMLLIDSETGLFNKEMQFQVPKDSRNVVSATEGTPNPITHYIYRFGGYFQYTPIKESKVSLFRYIGEAFTEVKAEASFLGVHGRYEQMNGTRDYSDWCKKAKFLGYRTLGIAEKATLAGTLPFQIACKKAGVKPILGESLSVLLGSDESSKIEVKLYAQNNEGWRNLLALNTIHNIVNGGYVLAKDLMSRSEGLVCVSSPCTLTSTFSWTDAVKKSFPERCYWQLTTNEYESEVREREVLHAMRWFIQNDTMPPVLLSDAYVLDYEDVHIKKVLNQAVGSFSSNTKNHYLRAVDELFYELESLFKKSDDRLISTFKRSVASTKAIEQSIDFTIDLDTLHLPSYEMTEEESEKYSSNDELFDALIREGIEKIAAEGKYSIEVLEERVASEVDVIKRGGFVDYFLILWDIVEWCRNQEPRILTGIGRGSAGGSLVSYCMGIILMNPLDYDLLFERFLNESRILNELPDIDIDFMSDRREEVVQYMKDRYGEDYVCQIGTYSTLQMRGVVKELCRVYNVEDPKTRNYLSHLIDEDNTNWSPLFVDAVKKPKLKTFVEENGYLVNDARIALNSIKTSSVHACATLIVPKVDETGRPTTVFEWIPMRRDRNGLLISEWEGEDLADAGFLKEDILSTQQMTKIGRIFEFIEKETGEKLYLEDIPLNDPEVFEMFGKGHTADVFHFGSSGLTAYSRQVEPSNIHELIAMIALYRPGAMISNAHTDFVKLKFGDAKPEYDFGLEVVTKDTFGLYIYQEQIMKAAQVLGGFSLVDADGVRKAMGKKIKSKMDEYKIQFVASAMEKGCPEYEAQEIWTKMEVFSGYGFNKSHAAAYAITGYICNWLKHHYPMAFWTVAFQHAKEEQISKYVHEIHQAEQISIQPPDLNVTQREFYSDNSLRRIYWSINKIRFVGVSALEYILSERDENGKYYSFDEFMERMADFKGDGRNPINKKVVTNLIYAGAFDEICGVGRPRERRAIISALYALRKEELPEEYRASTAKQDPFWELMQVEVSQLGMISYPQIISRSKNPAIASNVGVYHDGESFESRDLCKDGEFVLVAGRVLDVINRQDKNGKPYADLVIVNNNVEVKIRIFADIWNNNVRNAKRDYTDWKIDLESSKGRILLLTGRVNDFGNSRTLVAVPEGRGKKISQYDLF